MLNLNQLLSLAVLICLVFSSVVDYKFRIIHAYPWLVISVIGVTKLFYTIYETSMTPIVATTFLAMMLTPSAILVVLMKFQNFQLGDILALVGVGLVIPTSPFAVSPIASLPFSVYFNSVAMWIPFMSSKRFKNLPFLPFLCFGYTLSLLGDPHILFLLQLLK